MAAMAAMAMAERCKFGLEVNLDRQCPNGIVDELTVLPDEIQKALLRQSHQRHGKRHRRTGVDNVPVGESGNVPVSRLDLRYNNLVDLRDVAFLFGVADVYHLDVSNNRLASFPDVVLRTQIATLRCLELKHNALSSIPDDIGSMSLIMELNLGNNDLRTVPDAIGKLRHLKMVSFVSNKLEVLPDALSNCTNLEELHVGHNRLTGLSLAFRHLRKLKKLDLRHNQLLDVPEVVITFSELKQLYMGNNPLRDAKLPVEMTNSGFYYPNHVQRYVYDRIRWSRYYHGILLLSSPIICSPQQGSQDATGSKCCNKFIYTVLASNLHASAIGRSLFVPIELWELIFAHFYGRDFWPDDTQ